MSPSLSLQTSLSLSPDVILRQEAFGGLLFHRTRGQIFAINKVGYHALNACDGKTPVKQVLATVAARYTKVDPEAITRDVLPFLHDMLGKQLVIEVGG
jgi:hypothetical protein